MLTLHHLRVSLTLSRMRYMLLALVLAGCSASVTPSDAAIDVVYNCAIDCRLASTCGASCATLTVGAERFCAACSPRCDADSSVDCDRDGYRCTTGAGRVSCATP